MGCWGIAMFAFANRLGGENTFLGKGSSLPPNPLLFPKTFIVAIACSIDCTTAAAQCHSLRSAR